MIVDCHVHVELVWAEPVEALLWQMEQNGVSHAVISQLHGNHDNRYLLQCMERHPGKFRVLGCFDQSADDRVQALERFHRAGGSGIRISIQKERGYGPDDALFRAAGDLGMIVGVYGLAANFASARFKRLLDACPQTRFCLEHLARIPTRPPAILDELEPPYAVYRQALECAQWPNTSIKVPGLGTILVRSTERMPATVPWEFPPHYEMAKAAFGVERMMWSSGFPSCGNAEGYRNSLEWVRRIPAFQGEGELDWILGRTAARLWGFPH